MTIALALLALLLPIAILVAWHLDRTSRIDENRMLRADLASERKQWTDERRELLNRIKPETAQYAAPADATPLPRVVFDDDKSFHRAVDPLGVSKEDLAELDAGLDDLVAGMTAANGGGG